MDASPRLGVRCPEHLTQQVARLADEYLDNLQVEAANVGIEVPRSIAQRSRAVPDKVEEPCAVRYRVAPRAIGEIEE